MASCQSKKKKCEIKKEVGTLSWADRRSTLLFWDTKPCWVICSVMRHSPRLIFASLFRNTSPTQLRPQWAKRGTWRRKRQKVACTPSKRRCFERYSSRTLPHRITQRGKLQPKKTMQKVLEQLQNNTHLQKGVVDHHLIEKMYQKQNMRARDVATPRPLSKYRTKSRGIPLYTPFIRRNMHGTRWDLATRRLVCYKLAVRVTVMTICTMMGDYAH